MYASIAVWYLMWYRSDYPTFCRLPLVFSAHPLCKPGSETDMGKAKRLAYYWGGLLRPKLERFYTDSVQPSQALRQSGKLAIGMVSATGTGKRLHMQQ